MVSSTNCSKKMEIKGYTMINRGIIMSENNNKVEPPIVGEILTNKQLCEKFKCVPKGE